MQHGWLTKYKYVFCAIQWRRATVDYLPNYFVLLGLLNFPISPYLKARRFVLLLLFSENLVFTFPIVIGSV
jgi:hypothetical protein